MGAEYKKWKGAVKTAIRNFFEDDYKKSQLAFKFFLLEARELIIASKKWRSHLISKSDTTGATTNTGTYFIGKTCVG